MSIFDNLLATAMMGGGGGGGGSSDFSTAEVTITNNSSQEFIHAYIPVAVDADGFSNSQGEVFIEAETATYSVILYKGVSLIYIPNGGVSIATTGNIEDDGGGYFYVTGNCTITIS